MILGGAGCGAWTAGVLAEAKQEARRIRANRMRRLHGEDCMMMTRARANLDSRPRTVPNEGVNGSEPKSGVGLWWGLTDEANRPRRLRLGPS